jgi:hypothetical protein
MSHKLDTEGLRAAEAQLLNTIRSNEMPTVIHRTQWEHALTLRAKHKITLSAPYGDPKGTVKKYRRALPTQR